MQKDKRTDYKRAYNEQFYARLAITIPKAHKATLQAAADAQGESLNAYVNKAVLARLGLEEWPEGEGE